MVDSFKLPNLPWGKGDLAPLISEETINFHYGKHHQAYVNKLNELTEKNPDLQKMSLEDLCKTQTGVLMNQAAQVWNHTFYWHSLRPNKEQKKNLPSGEFMKKIEQDFGSFESFKSQFSSLAAGHFGSGWAWLAKCPNTKKLSVLSTHDAENPLMSQNGSLVPLLTCDMWEHAYYIDFRNSRPDYIKAFWLLVNWEFVEN